MEWFATAPQDTIQGELPVAVCDILEEYPDRPGIAKTIAQVYGMDSADCTAKANLIVTACNHHEELRKALEGFVKQAESFGYDTTKISKASECYRASVAILQRIEKGE